VGIFGRYEKIVWKKREEKELWSRRRYLGRNR